MYIPFSIVVVLLFIYFYEKDKIRDEISSLRGDLQNLNSNNYHDNNDFWDYAEVKTPVVENEKDEYTFQESQERGKLGVSYDTSLEDIKKTYYKLAREYQHSDPTKFAEMGAAYKRLQTKLSDKA